MSGRSGLVGPSGGSLAGPDPANQPMDLVKNTGRSMESGSIVKSGNTTLVHYTTGGVAQILTTSVATAHVVTAKPVGRSESMGVGSQTVTLVSRTSGPPAALNLASPNPGGGSNPAVRTVSHPSGTQTNNAIVTSSSNQLAYHIPRGPAVVANMSAPRSQTVATPIVRTAGQPLGHPNSNMPGPRSSVGGQRVVPASGGGWGRSTPSPAHTNKGAPTLHSSVSGTGLSLGVARGSLPSTRPGQPTGSIATYHPGGRPSGVPGGPIRGAGTTTMRGMVTDGPRMSGPKAVHITQPVVQPQKYGSGIMGSGGRSMTPGSSVSTAGSSGPIYTPGSPLVTTVAGQSLTSQGNMRNPSPAIAVRITTAPIPTSSTSAPVMSQAGTSIGALALTSPTGTTSGTILTHHPSLQRTSQDHHIPLKTPIVRTPVAAHQTSKAGVQAQTLTFPDGPKVITQPAQGPPVALTHISGLTGLTTQKGQVGTHTLQQQQQQQQQQQPQPQQQQHHQHQHQQPQLQHQQHQQQQHQQQQHHSTGVQHRGGNVVGSGVGRNIAGTAIPVAKVLPQQNSGPPQGPVSVASAPRVPHGQVRAQSPGQVADPQPAHTSVFLHRTHPGVAVTTGVTCGERVGTTVPQYSIAPQYYYDQGHNTTYQVGGTTLVPNTLGSTHYVPSSMQGGSLRVTAGASNPSVSNVGGVNGSGQMEGAASQQGTVPLPSMKPSASPRPSILRKRPDNDGTPLKAAKNLTTSLSMPVPSPPSPKRPDSRGNGNASSGSTTISANSSPGLQIEEMESGTTPVRGTGTHTPPSIKQEPPDDATIVLPRPSLSIPAPDMCPLTLNTMTTATLTVPQPHLSVATLHAPTQILADGLSPRKKPRKQQLMGNELQEARSSEDDLEHPPTKKNKRDLAEDSHDLEGSEDEGGGWSEPGGASSGGSCGGGGGGGGSGGGGGASSAPGASINNSVSTTVVLTNRPTMSLLSSFRQTWKPRHNHFVRHTDVKPKDEKRMTVNEIANQKLAMQRVNGWKIVHLSGQVDDLVELETEVVDRLHLLLSSLEKRTHPRKPYKDFEKDVNRLSELVKANIQRSKIIKDQMVEARSQMHKLFDHKGKIVDIMNKYSSKRSVRKKEKS